MDDRDVPIAICIIDSSGNPKKLKTIRRRGTVIDPPPIPKRAPETPAADPIAI